MNCRVFPHSNILWQCWHMFPAGGCSRAGASQTLQRGSKRIWSCFCLPSAGLHLFEQSTLPQPLREHLLVVTLGEHKPGVGQVLAALGTTMIR